MARTNTNHENRVYLNVIGGKFAERVKEGTSGSVKRFSEKKKEDVWEILNDRTSGTIKSMKIEKGDFGKQLLIEVNDVMESYIVTLPVESKYFDSFCAKIGNVKLNDPVELAPYSFEPKDGSNKKSGMNIYQNGEKVPYYFSKEDPKNKPFPVADNLDEDSWKIFKLQERKFYCEFIESLNVKQTSAEEYPKTKESIVENSNAGSQASSDLPF